LLLLGCVESRLQAPESLLDELFWVGCAGGENDDSITVFLVEADEVVVWPQIT
jgi:hypothetical protein